MQIESLTLPRIDQMIKGIVAPRPLLGQLTVRLDDRGSLYEVVHDYEMPCFGQAYLVRSPAPGTIRGFHRHQRLWDYFSIIQGRAKFVLVRTKDGEPSAVDEEWIVTLGEEAPALLVVPATVWHGWMSLTTDVILLSVASEVYCHSSPDEERIPWTTFGEDVWKIQNR